MVGLGLGWMKRGREDKEEVKKTAKEQNKLVTVGFAYRGGSCTAQGHPGWEGRRRDAAAAS